MNIYLVVISVRGMRGVILLCTDGADNCIPLHVITYKLCATYVVISI